jgi:hypothetical protein
VSNTKIFTIAILVGGWTAAIALAAYTVLVPNSVSDAIHDHGAQSTVTCVNKWNNRRDIHDVTVSADVAAAMRANLLYRLDLAGCPS